MTSIFSKNWESQDQLWLYAIEKTLLNSTATGILAGINKINLPKSWKTPRASKWSSKIKEIDVRVVNVLTFRMGSLARPQARSYPYRKQSP